MRVYFVVFNTNWGEKGLWGISRSPAKAIELATAQLIKLGWSELQFKSIEEKDEISFQEKEE